jgi:hypothetical protein
MPITMKMRVAIVGLLCALAFGAQAAWHSVLQVSVGFTPSCSQSTTYLAALTSPTLTEEQAFDTAICGLVSDGNFSILDGLYFYANTSAANARVNVISPGTFNLTTHGTCTFTADQGFTGDGSSCYQDTGYNTSSSGTNFARNSNSLGTCVLNNRVVANGSNQGWGSYDGTGNFYIHTYDAGGTVTWGQNPVAGDSTSSSGSQGAWIATRVGTNSVQLYLNNGLAQNDGSKASTALPNSNLFSMAGNNEGTATNWSSDQYGYFFMGGAMNGTVAGQVYSRLHTMMAALGNSAC